MKMIPVECEFVNRSREKRSFKQSDIIGVVGWNCLYMKSKNAREICSLKVKKRWREIEID